MQACTAPPKPRGQYTTLENQKLTKNMFETNKEGKIAAILWGRYILLSLYDIL